MTFHLMATACLGMIDGGTALQLMLLPGPFLLARIISLTLTSSSSSSSSSYSSSVCRSLEDQLSFQSTHALGFQHSPVDYLGLRKMAADHIRGNKEQFEAFLELPLEEYCDQMETTAEWGGHLELQAISAALGVCIEVYSADQPLLKIGEEHEGAPLRIAYHLHAYGLGEHYNSVRPITT